jgi:hypothetical protein
MSMIAPWMPTILVAASAALAFLFRNYVKAWITNGIQHSFDAKLEAIRAELREKEDKIKALRQIALSGATSRREALDKRHLEAVDKLWNGVIALGTLKLASKYMETVNFEESAKLAPTDANVRKLFETIGKLFNENTIPKISPAAERPYLSERAWALFSAYQAILSLAVVQIKALELGVPNSAKLLNFKVIDNLVHVALPHQMPLLEQYGTSACHYLVEELEQALLSELRRSLNEPSASREDVQTAAEILAISDTIMKDVATASKTVGLTV